MSGNRQSPRDSRSTSLKYTHLLNPFFITLAVLIPGSLRAADIHVKYLDEINRALLQFRLLVQSIKSMSHALNIF